MDKDKYRKQTEFIRNTRENDEIISFLQKKKILYPLEDPPSCPNKSCQNSKSQMYFAANRKRTKHGAGYRHSGCSTDRSC
jgi:hypothetical protein